MRTERPLVFVLRTWLLAARSSLVLTLISLRRRARSLVRSFVASASLTTPLRAPIMPRVLRSSFLPSRLRELVILLESLVSSYFLLWCVDIYITCVSSEHHVCSKGFYIAIVATTVETKKPLKELAPGIDLLGKVLEKYGDCLVAWWL